MWMNKATRWRGPFFSLLDAGTSSLGNLAISVTGAHFLTLYDFGIFSLLLTGSLLLVGFSKVWLMDPFTLAYSALPGHRRNRSARRALGAVLVVSTVVSLAVGATVLAFGASLELATLSLLLPVLALQDAYRWVCYTSGDSVGALSNTFAWTVTVGVGIVILHVSNSFSTAAALAVWALAAGLGTAIAAWRTNIVPSIADARNWITEARSVGNRSAIDYGLGQVVGLGAGMIITAIAGAAAYGVLRVAQLPLAVVQIMVTGSIAFLQPAMVRRVASGNTQGARKLAVYASTCLIGAVAVVAAIVMALPIGFVVVFLGDSWEPARNAVIILAVGLGLSAIPASFGPYLRATGSLTYEVVVKTSVFPVALLLIIVGAMLYGATGGAAGQALGTALIAILTVWRAAHNTPAEPTGGGASR
jgi:O-antigen/teichoic acid export membrane protein